MARQFRDACFSNDLELVKTLEPPELSEINEIFIYVCINGDLEMAKWLYQNGAEISVNNNKALIHACCYGQIHIAQWLYDSGIDISNQNNLAFIITCMHGQIYMAKWLHKLGANITDQDNRAFRQAITWGRVDIVKWLIEIHYKSSSFIHFDNYREFKLEIKNLLIDSVYPRQLEGDDLTYYLARTENLVPSDFDYPGTTKRGKRTKPALHKL